MSNGPEPAPQVPPEARCPSDPLEEPGLGEHATRLQADRELRDALAADGFTGPAYAVFEEEIANFGFAMMEALLRSGYIFARCREAGLHLPVRKIDASDREDLAQEVVAGALRSFKAKGLEQGGWQPECGASLRTYFAGALLRQFANVWRSRLSRTPDTADLSLDTVSFDMPSPAPGPADSSVMYDEIRRGLTEIENPKTRAALVLTEAGYQQEEIAEILGITLRAVEGLLRRHRSRVAARNQEGESRR